MRLFSRNPDQERQFRNAISGRWLVELRCVGSPDWMRLAPHALFWSEPGLMHLSGFLLVAANSAALSETERLFDLGRIVSVRLLEEQFEPSPRFHRGNSNYAGAVICSV